MALPIDPATGKPHTRTGPLYLYSDAGAAAILRANIDAINDAVACPVPVDKPESFRYTDTRSVYRDRNPGVPEYARTPGKHGAPYDQHARTRDIIWVQLFGPTHTHSRHARSNRD